MSESLDPAVTPAPTRSSGPTPGELLRTAREQRKLSLQQAAEDLHLDARSVEAMEDNRFAALGAPVYARGHLRKYAALVGLEPTQVLERYDALSDRPEVPTPIPSTAVTPLETPRPSLIGPLIILAVLVVGAIAWWALGTDRTGESQPVVVAEQPMPAEIQGESEQAETVVRTDSAPPASLQGQPQQTPPPPATPSNAPVVQQPAEQAAAAPAPEAPASLPPGTTAPALAASAPQAVAEAGQIRLQLDYREASWTEIHDAQGRRLSFGLGAAGDSRIVVGTPPLRVTLGLASAVTLQVDGRAVVIPRQAGRNAAHFTLAGDGTAQLIR